MERTDGKQLGSFEARRPAWRDHIALGLLGLVVYFFGLTDYGVDGFQEATRLCVAYEMQRAGEWIVPTRGGELYIAKPPMVYWALMGVAELRGGTVDLIDARVAIAAAGLIGLLCFYVVARRMLAVPTGWGPAREGDDAAWWAALGLGTGILYVRAARIAELDMLMIPFVVVAIGAVHAAWRASLERGRTHWPALGLAMVCSVGAALTKGPVPTMVIGLGIYAAIIAHGCWEARGSGGKRLALVVAGVLGIAAMVVSAGSVESGGEWPGVVVLGLVMAGLGYWIAQALRPAAVRAWWPHVWRTHPWLVLGAGLVAVALWLTLVDARAGGSEVVELVEGERNNNLQVLIAASPIKNIGFFVYGILPLSLAAIAGLVWIARDRPPLTPGQRAAVVWTMLGFVAFSVLGKGVARYLLPVWPGMAMLSGMWLVAAMRDFPQSPGGAARWRAVLYVCVGVAALANAWYYGMGRSSMKPNDSPEAMVTMLIEESAVDPSRVGTVGFTSPALNFHLARALPGWDGEYMYFLTDFGDPADEVMMDRLAERVRAGSGAYWVFVEARSREAFLEAAAARGLKATVAETPPWFRGSRGAEVRAVRPESVGDGTSE